MRRDQTKICRPMRMKSTAAIVAFAMAFAVIKAEENLKEKISKAFNDCMGKHHISDAELEALRKEDLGFDYSHDAKCMLACMLEEGKMLKGGIYFKETALIMADVFHYDDFDEASKARQVVEHCSVEVPQVGPDPCEFAYKLAVCGGNESKKLGMKEYQFFE